MSHAALTPGRMLARYRLLTKLGSGGQSAVWLAERADGGVFALKVQAATPEGDQRSLADEAQLLAQLTHPRIVRFHEIFIEDDLEILVMEYVDGLTIHDLIPKLQLVLTPDDRASFAVWLVVEILDALSYLHELKNASGESLGAIHRDLKPANIMLATSGELKLLDFGIAMFRGREFATATGMVIGTLPYLSPESMRGELIDSRSDIFAVGNILFAVLTGTPPFKRTNMAATLAAVSSDPVPSLPAPFRELDPIVQRALRRNKTQRYQTAREMRDALIGLGRSFDIDRRVALMTGGALEVNTPTATINDSAPKLQLLESVRSAPLAEPPAQPPPLSTSPESLNPESMNPIELPSRRLTAQVISLIAAAAVIGVSAGIWLFSAEEEYAPIQAVLEAPVKLDPPETAAQPVAETKIEPAVVGPSPSPSQSQAPKRARRARSEARIAATQKRADVEREETPAEERARPPAREAEDALPAQEPAKPALGRLTVIGAGASGGELTVELAGFAPTPAPATFPVKAGEYRVRLSSEGVAKTCGVIVREGGATKLSWETCR